MRTGTDATRAAKTRKKAAKTPASKSTKKSLTRPSSDVAQQTVIENLSQGAHDAVGELHSTEAVLSGHLISFSCHLSIQFANIEMKEICCIMFLFFSENP